MLQRLAVAVAAVAAVAIPLACDPDLPPISWEGERVRFGTTADHLPCGSTLEDLDRTVAELEQELDEPLHEKPKLTYYWLPGRMDLSSCPDKQGCAGELLVYAEWPLLVHELVHAVLLQRGRSHHFMMEGFAEAFGRRGNWLGMPPDAARQTVVDDLSSGLTSEDVDYQVAGMFTRFTIDAYGLLPLKQVYLRADRDTGLSGFEDLFSQELGVSLDDVLDRFTDEAPECYPPADACTAEPDPWAAEDLWQIRLDIECSAPNLTELTKSVFRSTAIVEIPAAGPYLVDVSRSSGSNAELHVYPCDFDEECGAESTWFPMAKQTVYGFEAGLYQVEAKESVDYAESAVSWVDVAISPL